MANLLEESRRLEREASKLTGIKPVLGEPGTPFGDIITSRDLAPTPTSIEPFRERVTTPPPSIQGITADLPKIEPSPIEQKGDVLSERLLAINESLLGRGAFRREQEAVAAFQGLNSH